LVPSKFTSVVKVWACAAMLVAAVIRATTRAWLWRVFVTVAGIQFSSISEVAGGSV
jgi:hypothetical protein